MFGEGLWLDPCLSRSPLSFWTKVICWVSRRPLNPPIWNPLFLSWGELAAHSVTAMVMSQGTYTFLACFAGFWLVWALVVMLCCFCSFLQRRLKRRREERLREQCLRTVEMEPLSCHPAGYPPAAPPPPPPQQPPQLPREPPQFSPPQTLSPPLPLPVPHPLPQATWVSMPGNHFISQATKRSRAKTQPQVSKTAVPLMAT